MSTNPVASSQKGSIPQITPPIAESMTGSSIQSAETGRSSIQSASSNETSCLSKIFSVLASFYEWVKELFCCFCKNNVNPSDSNGSTQPLPIPATSTPQSEPQTVSSAPVPAESEAPAPQVQEPQDPIVTENRKKLTAILALSISKAKAEENTYAAAYTRSETDSTFVKNDSKTIISQLDPQGSYKVLLCIRYDEVVSFIVDKTPGPDGKKGVHAHVNAIFREEKQEIDYILVSLQKGKIAHLEEQLSRFDRPITAIEGFFVKERDYSAQVESRTTLYGLADFGGSLTGTLCQRHDTTTSLEMSLNSIGPKALTFFEPLTGRPPRHFRPHAEDTT
jgi:hypothetical protein